MKRIFKFIIGVIALFITLLIGLNIYINNTYKEEKKNATMTLKELTELSKTVKDERMNVLLLGVDNLSAEDNYANMRTDTMMVLSVDPKTKTGFILSIPRDTRTKIEGYKYVYNKINSAHSIGGINLTIKTVKDLLGIPIHHFVEVDYQALFKTVNDIGGVEVYVPMDMQYDDPYAKPPLHIDLKQGLQVLDGEKAMHFLRFRHGYADQDLGRIHAQQEFMNSVIKKILSVDSLVNIPSYIDTFYKFVKTDMNLSQMFQIASKAIEIKPHNIKRETLIGKADFLNGVSYYILDDEQMRVQLDNLLQGKYYSENDVSENVAIQENEKKEDAEKIEDEKMQDNTKSENIDVTKKENSDESKKINYVVVLNGVGKSGLAQRAKDLLYVNNIDVQDTANADKFDYIVTQIYYKDNLSLAEEVRNILGAGNVIQENKAYYEKPTDILVVLGSDFTK